MSIIDIYMKRLLGLLKKWFGSSYGFTLIELLVVIAILGVLLVGSIVAINPAQKINQAKDATSKAAVDQVAAALQAWSTQNNGTYPTTAQWSANILVTSGELKTLPTASGTSGSVALTYSVNATFDNASVSFTLLQKDTSTSGCSTGTPCTIWCWQSNAGKASVVTAATGCTAP